MGNTPYEEIRQRLQPKLPHSVYQLLPSKWEKIGTILILKLPQELNSYTTLIGHTYADILECTSVLQDTGGVSGELRQPNTKLIYGDTHTETIHIENAVKYQLDPQQVMFSSGNMDERIRMATISNPKEVVIDLFAGIGYFTIPMAVYSQPKQIYACELNPVSYQFLENNCIINKVTSTVTPLQGDNRQTAPHSVADRVLMGYFENIQSYLPLALNCLKSTGGIIHYHTVVSKETMNSIPQQQIEQAAQEKHLTTAVVHTQVVKSYAPHINHVVIDAEVKPQ